MLHPFSSGLQARVRHKRPCLSPLQVEKRGVHVNQQDRAHGWTPLMRAARVAHYTDRPRMEVG